MTPEQMNELLSRRNNAIVGVNRAVGGPQLTPVWYVWHDSTFTFSTMNNRMKYFNLKRDHSITLIVDDPELGYVVAYGQATLIEQNVAELSRPIVEKYMPSNIEQGMEMMSDPRRVLVVVRPDKVITSQG